MVFDFVFAEVLQRRFSEAVCVMVNIAVYKVVGICLRNIPTISSIKKDLLDHYSIKVF